MSSPKGKGKISPKVRIVPLTSSSSTSEKQYDEGFFGPDFIRRIQDVPGSLYEALFPQDLHAEIWMRKSPKEYIAMCLTSKAQLQKCMQAEHWTSYMRFLNSKGMLSLENCYTILRFTSQYITTHPRMFVETSDLFLEIYGPEIKEIHRHKNRGKGKVTAKVKNTRRQDLFFDISELAAKAIKRLMSINFDEATYGKIEDLESSNMFKLFLKLQTFDNILSGSETDTIRVAIKFWGMFPLRIRIADRSLDAKILDFVFPREFELQLKLEFVVWSYNLYDCRGFYGKYIVNNGNTREEREGMLDKFLVRLESEYQKEVTKENLYSAVEHGLL